MSPEDHYIACGNAEYNYMTYDVFYFLVSGMAYKYGLNSLVNINELGIYECYKEWYETKAYDWQKFLCDAYGYLNIDKQFQNQKEQLVHHITKNVLLNRIQNKKIEIKDEPLNELSVFKNNILVIDSKKKYFEKIDFEKFDYDNTTELTYINKFSVNNNYMVMVNNLLKNLSKYDKKTYWEDFEKAAFFQHEAFEEIKKEDMRRLILMEEGYLPDEDYLDRSKEESSYLMESMQIDKSKEEKYIKKAIKKGLKTLSSLVTNKNANAFVSGDGFQIDGENFNFFFKKNRHSNTIWEHTKNPISSHIPYQLEILNKDNVLLCEICVFFPDTPIIDQLIAAILYIQSGNEEELIKAGNIMNATDAYYDNECITKIHNKMPPQLNEIRNLLENESDGEKAYSKIKSEIFEKIKIETYYKSMGILSGFPNLKCDFFEKDIVFDEVMHYFIHQSKNNKIIEDKLNRFSQQQMTLSFK